MSDAAFGRVPEPILVTGAAGFLGSAVVRALRSSGHDVIGADRTVERGPEALVPLDLTNAARVSNLVREQRPKTVLHFAAYGLGDAGLLASAEKDPRRAVDVNVNGFVNLLDAAATAGVDRVVWSSSTTVYGPPRLYAPAERVDEASPPAPTTCYGATKMMAERIAQQVASERGVSITGLRLPLVYGPGRWYGGAQATWMRFAREVVEGRSVTYAFGRAPEDWIYVDDAVAAVLAAVAADRDLAAVYNVGGTTTSAFEAARTLVGLLENDSVVEPLDDPPSIVLVDGGAFATATGYVAEVPVEDGLRRLVDAFQREGSTA